MRCFLLLTLSCIASLVAPNTFAAETTRPLRVTVVERDTGKPVAGAEVRYRGDAHEGTFTGHGGRNATLFDLREKTNAEGIAVFPPTTFDRRPFGWFATTHLDGPRLIVTKEGFLSREVVNMQYFPALDEYLAWGSEGTRIELTPGRDPNGRGASQRLDEQDEFQRAVSRGELPKGLRDPRGNPPPFTIKVAPPPIDANQKAATPALPR